jgi:CO/xanthine dehydrogenase FAD-binding subunit
MEFLKVWSLTELINEAAKIKNKIYFLAGGTDFMVMFKDDMIPDDSTVIDISGVKELRFIKEEANKIIIGSLTTFSDILESKLIEKQASVLYQAVSTIGSPQIRNMGTIGGNIANASPAGDSIPALFIHNAKIVTNLNEYKITDFFTGVKSTVLKNGEFIKDIEIEKLPKGSKCFFFKSGQRKALSISKVSLALGIKLNRGRVDFIRISAGAVSKTVIRATKTEDFLFRSIITKDTIEKAKEILKNEISPITDFRSTENYRKEMSSYFLEKALLSFIGSHS